MRNASVWDFALFPLAGRNSHNRVGGGWQFQQDGADLVLRAQQVAAEAEAFW